MLLVGRYENWYDVTISRRAEGPGTVQFSPSRGHDQQGHDHRNYANTNGTVRGDRNPLPNGDEQDSERHTESLKGMGGKGSNMRDCDETINAQSGCRPGAQGHIVEP